MSRSQGVSTPLRNAPRRRRRRRWADQTPYGRALSAAHRPKPGRRFYAGPKKAAYRPPPGSVVVGTIADWRAVWCPFYEADPRLRSDGRRTRLALLQALGERHWSSTGRAIAGHAALAVRVGQILGRRVGRSTIGDHMRALEEDGAIGVEQHGCSALIAGRNLAPTYVLLVDTDRPWDDGDTTRLQRLLERLGIGPAQGVDRHHPDRVLPTAPGSENGQAQNRYAGKFSLQPQGPKRRAQPELFAPRTHRERCAAVEWLIRDLGWRHDEQTRAELGKLSYPLFVAGWAPKAVRAAMDRPPVGDRYPDNLPGPRHDDRARPLAVRNRFALLNHRLGLWLAGGRWRKDAAPAYDAPLAAAQPARGRPVEDRPTEPGPPPATLPAAALREAALAGIAAGNSRRRQADEAFRAGRRLSAR